jgi:MinD-like ATPase involved in chromosome partitioning or flagellar assembly
VDVARLTQLGVTSHVAAPAAGGPRAAATFAGQVVAAVVAVAAARGDKPERRVPTDDTLGPGTVIAVWGPTGAPGRTTVAIAVADELARSGVRTLLADGDTYGPSVAQRLGVLDEASGVAAAVRLARAGTLRPDELSSAARTLPAGLAVLTGLTRADRWPELPAPLLQRVWTTCRSVADVTVVDCGFCLEEDDELSYDAVVARRNAATLATLAVADILLVVGSADVVGTTRLVRGLHELAELADRRPGAVPEQRRVVLNRATPSARRSRGIARSLSVADVDGSLAAAVLVPDDADAAARSVADGRALAEVAPRSSARTALRRLAEQLRPPDLGSAGAVGRGARAARGAGGVAAEGGAGRNRRRRRTAR